MKEIRKEIQRIEEVIKYESVDGREFNTKEDCKKWEESYECTIRAAMKKIPQIETDCSDIFIVNPPEERVIVLKPRNIEDIKVINAYGKMLDNFTEPLTQDDIEKILMIYTGYNEDWFVIYRTDKYLKEINSRFDDFKEQINRLERQM